MEPTKHDLLVLVVDDEPCVRMLSADVLEDAGFGVLEACNAEEALRVLDTRSDVRVVFTDIEMPGSLDGLALARRIHERWPRIGVVVTSGRGTVDHPSMPDRFIPKPYSPGVLVRQIEAVFARAAAANGRP
jgi:CheY-like chemotaxis protein